MEPVLIPDFPTLRGEKAIEALCDFVSELEEQRSEELTEKQTKTLMKFAWGLISSIEVETRSNQIANELLEQMRKKTSFATQLRKTIARYVPESVTQALHFA